MPKIIVSEEAKADFFGLDKSTMEKFSKHIKKLEIRVPRKRLRHNSKYLVEEVGQGRIICRYDADILEILRIFKTHKEYEKWFSGV